MDISQIGSKVVTEVLERLLSDKADKVEIINYYSHNNYLPPIKKMQEELDALSGKKIDILKEAAKLHKKYAWIPVNFVGEPWSLDDIKGRIKNNTPEKRVKLIKPKTKVSAEAKYYCWLLGEIGALNEYRKSVYSQACYIIRGQLDNLAKQHGLNNWRSLNFLMPGEILDLSERQR